MSAVRRLLAVAPLGRRGRLGLAGAAGLGAVAVLAAVGLLTTSGYLISRAAQHPEILSLAIAIVGVRFFGLLRALARYGERLVSHDVALRSIGAVRRRFFAALVPLVPAGLGTHRRGELLSRFVADVDRLQDVYLRALLPPLIALVASAGALLVAVLLYPPAALVLAVSLLAGALLVPALTRRAARSASRNQAAARAELSAGLVEICAGAGEIVVAGRERDWIERSDNASARLAAIQRRDALGGGLGFGLQAALLTGTAVALAAVAIPAVGSGALPGVLLAAVVLLGIAAQEAVAPMPAAAASIDSCSVAAERIGEIVDAPAPTIEPADPAPLPARGAIVADGVGFAYPGGERLLHDIDLRWEPGQSLALSGPSGCGKTTLAELLVRFADPTEGSITLGGVDLCAVDDSALRSVVLLAAQDAYAFSVSLRENLLLGNPDADDVALVVALERVGLGPWFASLPEGLGTRLGEQGATISGGQRQRIAVARALLSPARFLILDEPTAHVDPEAAVALLGELRREADAGRGVLVITHEPTGTEDFDRHLRLESGRLLFA